MTIFKNIPHVRRVVYERTFMNEISLLFTYNTIRLDIASEVIARLAPDMHLGIEDIDKDGGKEAILVKDKNALITFTPNAVLVSLPTREYLDFTKTEFLWNDVETLFRELEVCPIVWSFTKGNRWVFNKAILPGQENDVFKVVLSENLLKNTAEDHIYVEEATDNSCVFTCRYGIEKVNEKDSVGMKTMIASRSYTVENLCHQVFSVNDLMFDVWHWCVSDSVKDLMNPEK
ncbi:MAG: hypothetical protein J6R41_06115 [Paludibacteraceae bacterium]|nr:hypothetical protein [Paludibacteraceae bacterium]MBO7192700.1 hypothetical protein [Bacteroidaceae bacterium]